MNPIAIFRHVAAEGPGYFSDFLDARNIPWTLIAIDLGEAVPPTASAYSGLVFMGGPMSVNDDLPWIPAVLALIREAVALDIPVLGHCLGGQLISKALGGVVSKNPHKEIGWGEVSVAENSVARDWFGDVESDVGASLLAPLPQAQGERIRVREQARSYKSQSAARYKFNAFHWHGETFSLPQGATLLLANSACAHQGYAIGKHLALQCHVEMTAAMIDEWCAIGADEIASAQSSYVQSAHEIKQLTPKNLADLHKIASRLYTKWLAGALNSPAS